MKIIRLSNVSCLKQIVLALALFCAAHLTASAAVDLGAVTDRTPYDAYLTPVQQVLNNMRPAGVTMTRVQALMRQGRAFGYHHYDKFQPATPELMVSRQQGDCKDKALWLMNQLQDPSARFVIGKFQRDHPQSHAWVMWQNGGRWWILDCTMLDHAIPADSVGMNDYVPLFSYTRGMAFRHTEKANFVADTGSRSKSGV